MIIMAFSLFVYWNFTAIIFHSYNNDTDMCCSL